MPSPKQFKISWMQIESVHLKVTSFKRFFCFMIAKRYNEMNVSAAVQANKVYLCKSNWSIKIIDNILSSNSIDCKY